MVQELAYGQLERAAVSGLQGAETKKKVGTATPDRKTMLMAYGHAHEWISCGNEWMIARDLRAIDFQSLFDRGLRWGVLQRSLSTSLAALDGPALIRHAVAGVLQYHRHSNYY